MVFSRLIAASHGHHNKAAVSLEPQAALRTTLTATALAMIFRRNGMGTAESVLQIRISLMVFSLRTQLTQTGVSTTSTSPQAVPAPISQLTASQPGCADQMA